MRYLWQAAITLGTCLCFIPAANAADACGKLAGLRIPERAIGLPSRGARIEKAAEFPAEDDLPETCRVNGEIIGSAPDAPPIKFQINLPRHWNSKAVHFGGGGFDGILVDGLHSMPGYGPADHRLPNPLAQGYATFGSDGGHQAANPMDASFGRNPEARENYMGAAVKRTRDAAVAIIERYYRSSPRRLYFAGGSKGGHEGLVAAQRYGSGYDGVISYFPAKDSVGLILGWGALTEAAYGKGGTALSTQKQQLVERKVLAACDGLDGLKDGVIANVEACTATISPASLICSPGGNPDDCLTDAEAATLAVGLRRTLYPFPLANGVSSIGPFPVMSGGSLDRVWLSPSGRSATVYEFLANGIARNFWTTDDQATFGTLDFDRLRQTIVQHSQASDATSTDLDAFIKRGGKLILVQGSTDMLVPPAATTDYFLRLSARYGDRTKEFARYLMQPGYGHGGGNFDLVWDSLAALDTWVETGSFPAAPVASDGNAATRNRQMPLCEYPLFPRYVAGDGHVASSFRCSGQ